MSLDIEELSVKNQFRLEVKAALMIYSSMNTAFSMKLYYLLSYKQYEDFLETKLNPLNYEKDVTLFQKDYYCYNLLRKSPNFPLHSLEERKGAAVAAFLQSESQCKASNLRLRNDRSRDAEMFEASRILNDIIGPLTTGALARIESLMGHGSGSTATIRLDVSLPKKYGRRPSLTKALYPFYKALIPSDEWYLYANRPEVVRGNRFSDVPKDSEEERGICAEPDLNLRGQLGVGRFWKERLYNHANIDLYDQSRNQEMARRAYHDKLITLDLSKASDSNCTYLVLDLFSPDWFKLLDCLRSHETKLNDRWVELEKFSSMGNGFTFELETLIFLSLARCIVPEEEWDDVSVYGDDLIVPAAYGSSIISLLGHCGFTVNERKSFLAGNFFESCGSHWYKGISCPVSYFKGASDNGFPYSISLANKLRIAAHEFGSGYYCASVFKRTWTMLFELSPRAFRLSVPASLGDVGIIVGKAPKRLPSQHDPISGIYKGKCVNQLTTPNKPTFEGMVIKTIRIPSTKKVHFHPGTLLAVLDSTTNRSPNLLDQSTDKYQFDERLPTYGRFSCRGLFSLPRKASVRILHWTEGFHWGPSL